MLLEYLLDLLQITNKFSIFISNFPQINVALAHLKFLSYFCQMLGKFSFLFPMFPKFFSKFSGISFKLPSNFPIFHRSSTNVAVYFLIFFSVFCQIFPHYFGILLKFLLNFSKFLLSFLPTLKIFFKILSNFQWTFYILLIFFHE